jgi:protein-S-isoprenylcysteine O-methyltransferase Ste14
MSLLGVDMILLDVDPNVVKPGWAALIVVLLLGIAMVFLYLSMRKQFRKIRVPEDDAADNAERAASEQPPHTQS